jgi:hypothetical protein
MKSSERAVKAALPVASAGLLAVAAPVVGTTRTAAIATVADIEEIVAAPDPATRAAVIARLTVDAAERVKGHFHEGH